MFTTIHCNRWPLRLRRLSYLPIFLAALFLFFGQFEFSAATEYEAYIDRAVEVWRFQGSYLVARGESILARGSRGMADLDAGRANFPETRFLLGSMTKSFTAIAALQLVERGLIDPGQKITTYIDSYPAEKGTTITVHDLLCHRSGIPDVIANREFAKRMGDSLEPLEIVSYFREEPLIFEPGSQYAYSSSNYVLLGLIIEAVTGSKWQDYIDNHICRPVEMKNTGVFNDYANRSDFARGYALDRSGSLVGVPSIHPTLGYAAGALASTVDDLNLLNRALYDTILLSSQSIQTMLTAHSPAYGYGWLVDDFGGHKLTAHGGGAPGYVSIMQRWPDDSVCVIVLSNNVAVSVHTIANGLAAIALNEPYEMPRIKKPISMAPGQLAEYEGTYSLGSGEFRRVQLQEGMLMVQRSGGPARPVMPEDRDKFYFAHDQMTTLIFLRDSEGAIIAQVLCQAFNQDTAWRADH